MSNSIIPDGSSNAIITVVRDPYHWLGKCFDLHPDGTVSKKASVNLSFGIAVMHHVPTHADLAKLLTEVGNDPSAAIINASFDGIKVGEEFAILSEHEIEKRLGIPGSDRARQKGVHQIEHNGKQIKAVGRFKDNTLPSNWQLLDRDIDEHTPEPFRNLTTGQWLQKMATIIPGVDQVSYVETPSNSSRVILDGMAVGAGNGHVWIKVDNPADIERARPAMMVRAVEAGMSWKKPRFSKKEDGKVVGHGYATILDPSVWTVGRLVFDGKPTVGDGLTVSPLLPVIHTGERDSLDTAAMTIPDPKTIREITRKAGVEMDVKMGSSGLRIVANNLTLDTEIESKEHGILSVREMMARGLTSKVRCQAPFRASESFAAFFSINADGIPFVYDITAGAEDVPPRDTSQPGDVLPTGRGGPLRISRFTHSRRQLHSRHPGRNSTDVRQAPTQTFARESDIYMTEFICSTPALAVFIQATPINTESIIS